MVKAVFSSHSQAVAQEASPQVNPLSANWIGGSGLWTDNADWSTEQANGTYTAVEPAGNYDVVIQGGASPITVTYKTNDAIDTLGTGANVALDIDSGTLTLTAAPGDQGAGGSVDMKGGLLDLQQGWSISGGLTMARAAAIEIDSGVLTLYGNSTLAGSVTGAGDLYFRNGDYTIDAGFACSTGTLELGVNGDGFGTDTTLDTNLSYGGDFLLDDYSGNSSTLTLNGHNASLSGNDIFDGVVAGPGNLAVSGQGTIAYLALQNNADFSDNGTITQTGNTNLAGTVTVQKGAVWNITGGGSNSTSGSLVNRGLYEKTGAGGTSYLDFNVTNSGSFAGSSGTIQVEGSFTSTGTISGDVTVLGAFSSTGSINAGSLTLLGGGTLGGHYGGTGTIDLQNGAYALAAKTSLAFGTLEVTNNANLTLASAEGFAGAFNLSNGGTVQLGAYALSLSGAASLGSEIEGSGTLTTRNATIGNFILGGTATWVDNGTITQTTNSQLGASSTDSITLSIGAGRVYDITGGYNLGNSNRNDTGLGTITSAGLFEMTGSSGTAQIWNTDFTSTGTLLVDSGVSLNGPTAVLGGKIEGAGKLYLNTGWTLQANAAVTVAYLENDGAGTLTANATLARSFVENVGASIDLAGHVLTLTAADSLDGSIGDQGTLSLKNATLSNFTAYGHTTLVDTDKIFQTGSISLGDGSTDNVTLDISAGAIYEVSGSNQQLGNGNQNDTGVATINNAGLFEIAAGNSVAVWHSAFSNTGTLLANGGIYLEGNTASLGGTLSGSGILQLSTTWTLAATAVVSVAQLDNEGTGTLTSSLSYAGSFTNGVISELDLAGQTLTLSGPASLGGYIGGTGTVSVANATLSSFNIYGSATLLDTGTITQTGAGNLGDSSTDTVKLTISAGATYSVAGDLGFPWLGNPNVNDTGTSTILNAGLFSVGAGSDLTIWHSNFTNTGTLSSAGTLTLGYQPANLGGTIEGTGEVIALGGFTLAAHTVLSVATFDNAGSGTLLASLTDTGAWVNSNGASLALGGYTLTLADGGSLSGTIGGAGKLVVSGGTFAVAGGGTLSTASFALSGASSLTLAQNLSYAGSFTASPGSASESILLGTQTLALSGTTKLTGAASSIAVDNAGTLALSGSATLAGLSIGGGALLLESGAAQQTGVVTLGDSSGSGSLSIAAGGMWAITANTSIGTSGTGDAITNAGLFEKTAGTGKTSVLAAFTNTGTLEVTSGSLVFTGGFTNDGTIIGTETTSNGTVTITAASMTAADFGLAGVVQAAPETAWGMTHAFSAVLGEDHAYSAAHDASPGFGHH